MLRPSSSQPFAIERAFGASVGTLLLLIAGWLWRDRPSPGLCTAALGATLILLACSRPSLLRRPRAAWWQLAMFVGHINAQIILTLCFVLVLTPIGVVWRLTRRDPLMQKRRNWTGWSAYPSRYRASDHYSRMY